MNHRESIPIVDRLVCRADIHLDALRQNFELLNQTFGHGELVCMVKANAYGHGAPIVAPCLQEAGAKWFGVATVEEGVELRRANVNARVLLMSASGFHFALHDVIEHQLTPLISSMDEAKALVTYLREIYTKAPETPFAVHIDCDTGMTRGGFLSLDDLEILLSWREWIDIEGMSTHFARAEETVCNFSALQLDRFAGLLHKCTQHGWTPKYLHVDKSGAILLRTSRAFRDELLKTSPKLCFLGRPGIALYGVDPTREKHFAERLKPVLSWRAPIVLRKKIPKGCAVGYDGTFVAERPTEVAIVRVGYADGLKRSLSNQGRMLIDDIYVPIIGRISMDLTAINVSALVDAYGEASCEVGRFAQIIGGGSKNSQSVFNLAKDCDTIPYEILTSISARVQRFAT